MKKIKLFLDGDLVIVNGIGFTLEFNIENYIQEDLKAVAYWDECSDYFKKTNSVELDMQKFHNEYLIELAEELVKAITQRQAEIRDHVCQLLDRHDILEDRKLKINKYKEVLDG